MSVLLTQAELDGLFAELKVTPHPILKLPTLAWVQDLMRVNPDDWTAELVTFLRTRQQRLALAEEDPLWWGWEGAPWADADGLLHGTYKGIGEPLKPADILAIFGGNRAMKSWYAVNRACMTAMIYPKATVPILSESETASVKTVQALVWYYLKFHVGMLNGRRDLIYKINYTQAEGFTNRKLVLPNGSEIYFLTYNQDPGDYEGWEFGAPAGTYTAISAERRAKGEFVPPNVGAVADESMPLAWLKMFGRRLKFRRSKLLWPFTPVKGITPSIKELVGSTAVTLESRVAELLPRKNLPSVPEGHMPYIRQCQYAGTNAMAIYFFSIYNPFGPDLTRTYYDEIKQLCTGKASEFVERVAYGYARDGVARAFPRFGEWNIVKRSQLPAVGTNYHLLDPAGTRNWAMIWVRVTPSGDHYIYRDWPDAQTYGEWAVPTEREVNEQNRSGWDGDMGPAQPGMGFGIVKYKETILKCEQVMIKKAPHQAGTQTPHPPVPLPVPLSLHAEREAAGDDASNPERLAAEREEWFKREYPDPYQRRLAQRAGPGAEAVQEEIAERYIDPRAGANEHTAEKGGTCIIDEFDEVQIGHDGRVSGPSMELIPASGVTQDEGWTAVNNLLDWNPEQPLMPILNCPKLFVCEDCQQVIWMFENFTGKGGEKGACKDFADLVRYMALANLEYMDISKLSGKPGRGF